MFAQEGIAAQFREGKKVKGFTAFLACLRVRPLCIAIDEKHQIGVYIAESPNPHKAPYSFGVYKSGEPWTLQPGIWLIPGVEQTSDNTLSATIKEVTETTVKFELRCNNTVHEEMFNWTPA